MHISTPGRVLTTADAVFIIVGIVIGAGIFKAPSLVAANTASDWAMLAVWLAGGALALVGALCYAELSSAYPDTGGDYHFLRRAFGPHPAFLFAWARLAVMQTGSIALLAYVFGDYTAQLLPAGDNAAAIYAALAVVIFTLINVRGIRQGTGTQRCLHSGRDRGRPRCHRAGPRARGRCAERRIGRHDGAGIHGWSIFGHGIVAGSRAGLRPAHLRRLERSGVRIR